MSRNKKAKGKNGSASVSSFKRGIRSRRVKEKRRLAAQNSHPSQYMAKTPMAGAFTGLGMGIEDVGGTNSLILVDGRVSGGVSGTYASLVRDEPHGLVTQRFPGVNEVLSFVKHASESADLDGDLGSNGGRAAAATDSLRAQNAVLTTAFASGGKVRKFASTLRVVPQLPFTSTLPTDGTFKDLEETLAEVGSGVPAEVDLLLQVQLGMKRTGARERSEEGGGLVFKTNMSKQDMRSTYRYVCGGEKLGCAHDALGVSHTSCTCKATVKAFRVPVADPDAEHSATCCFDDASAKIRGQHLRLQSILSSRPSSTTSTDCASCRLVWAVCIFNAHPTSSAPLPDGGGHAFIKANLNFDPVQHVHVGKELQSQLTRLGSEIDALAPAVLEATLSYIDTVLTMAFTAPFNPLSATPSTLLTTGPPMAPQRAPPTSPPRVPWARASAPLHSTPPAPGSPAPRAAPLHASLPSTCAVPVSPAFAASTTTLARHITLLRKTLASRANPNCSQVQFTTAQARRWRQTRRTYGRVVAESRAALAMVREKGFTIACSVDDFIPGASKSSEFSFMDPDDAISEALAAARGYAFPAGSFLGFINQDQAMLAIQYAHDGILQIDTTHNVTVNNLHLMTLMVPSPHGGSIPLFASFVESENSESLTNILNVFDQYVERVTDGAVKRIVPRLVVCDMARSSRLVVESRRGWEGVEFRFCLFHVLRRFGLLDEDSASVLRSLLFSHDPTAYELILHAIVTRASSATGSHNKKMRELARKLTAKRQPAQGQETTAQAELSALRECVSQLMSATDSARDSEAASENLCATYNRFKSDHNVSAVNGDLQREARWEATRTSDDIPSRPPRVIPTVDPVPSSGPGGSEAQADLEADDCEDDCGILSNEQVEQLQRHGAGAGEVTERAWMNELGAAIKKIVGMPLSSLATVVHKLSFYDSSRAYWSSGYWVFRPDVRTTSGLESYHRCLKHAHGVGRTYRQYGSSLVAIMTCVLSYIASFHDATKHALKASIAPCRGELYPDPGGTGRVHALEIQLATIFRDGDPAGHSVVPATVDRSTVRTRAVVATAPHKGDTITPFFSSPSTHRAWTVVDASPYIALPTAMAATLHDPSSRARGRSTTPIYSIDMPVDALESAPPAVPARPLARPSTPSPLPSLALSSATTSAEVPGLPSGRSSEMSSPIPTTRALGQVSSLQVSSLFGTVDKPCAPSPIPPQSGAVLSPPRVVGLAASLSFMGKYAIAVIAASSSSVLARVDKLAHVPGVEWPFWPSVRDCVHMQSPPSPVASEGLERGLSRRSIPLPQSVFVTLPSTEATSAAVHLVSFWSSQNPTTAGLFPVVTCDCKSAWRTSFVCVHIVFAVEVVTAHAVGSVNWERHVLFAAASLGAHFRSADVFSASRSSLTGTLLLNYAHTSAQAHVKEVELASALNAAHASAQTTSGSWASGLAMAALAATEDIAFCKPLSSRQSPVKPTTPISKADLALVSGRRRGDDGSTVPMDLEGTEGAMDVSETCQAPTARSMFGQLAALLRNPVVKCGLDALARNRDLPQEVEDYVVKSDMLKKVSATNAGFLAMHEACNEVMGYANELPLSPPFGIQGGGRGGNLRSGAGLGGESQDSPRQRSNMGSSGGGKKRKRNPHNPPRSDPYAPSTHLERHYKKSKQSSGGDRHAKRAKRKKEQKARRKTAKTAGGATSGAPGAGGKAGRKLQFFTNGGGRRKEDKSPVLGRRK